MNRIRLLAALAALSLAAAAAAAPSGPTRFAPVQDGPAAAAETVLPWAPDRAIVQLPPAALAASTLPPAAKAAGPVRTTGLAGVDAVLADRQVTGIARAFRGPAAKAAAADLGVERWLRIDAAAAGDIPALAARLAAEPGVQEALPDYRAFPSVVPDDPDYADNWGHENTAQLPEFLWAPHYSHTGPGVGLVGFDANADQAWDGSQGYGDPSVIIAIIDSGVDTAHPDLNLVAGYDYGDNDGDPMDDSGQPGHGTACAGVAAAVADNGTGVAGVAGGCAVMPLKAADSQGSLYFSYIVDAVYHAADNGADVVSMSFGAAVSTYSPMDTALQYAFNQGCVLLAATGNENDSTIGYPAINAYVIAVGAASPCGDRKRSSSNSNDLNPGVIADPNSYTCDGERWWGSNYGVAIADDRRAVDVLAPTILPTTDISGTAGYQSGDYEPFFNGTSCATPYAAGVAALIKSANPTWTASQIRTQLRDTARDVVNVESGTGWDRYSGYGMVDAAAAVGAGGPVAPTAAFVGTPTDGCAPQLVSFLDQSTGDVDTWAWDFGDGGTSTDQNPDHTYAAAGAYDVTLAVSGPAGVDTLTSAAYVTVGEGPTAGFTTASATTGTLPLLIEFTDTSSGATSWTWDFGDGGGDTVQEPVHSYTQYGTFTVTQIVANACGTDTLVAVDYVTVLPQAPTAAFSGDPTAGCAPLTVSFTDESTGIVESWAWDFGDGGTATEQNPLHEYADPGSYDVTLIVTNAGGADTLTAAAYVTVAAGPSADFAASDSTGTAPLEVTFTNLSSGADAWSWDFGDGGTSTAQDPVHTYSDAGTYTVVLVATSACGADTLTAADVITVDAPPVAVADFSLDPAAGCAPLEVAFTDQSAGGVTAWDWDFGDGGTSTDQNPIHLYADPGAYDVTLIATAPGGSDTLTVAGAVTVGTPVAAAFAISDTLGAPPLTVTFTDETTGGPTSWLWDFGDGATDTVPDPVHAYTADGVYDVTLIVGNGCSADTLTVTGAVEVNSLSAVGGRVPAGFGLAQNFPNPFNPATTITYAVTKAGPVRLEVYDTAGRRVAVLVDEEKGRGEHSVVWQPRNLASGVYFARFTAEGRHDTRRLVLLK